MLRFILPASINGKVGDDVVTRLRALTIVALLIALVGGLPGIVATAKAASRMVRVATHDMEHFVM